MEQQQQTTPSSTPFVLFSSSHAPGHSIQSQSAANTAEFKDLYDRLLALPPPPPPSSDHHFRIPTKVIRNRAALEQFVRSSAHDQFLGFICRLNEAAKGRTRTGPCHVSPSVEHMIDVLQTMQAWVAQIPPHPHRSRFGNEAFVTWFDKVVADLPGLMQRALLPAPPPHADQHQQQRHHDMIEEVSAYLVNAVGDRQRIDYGTGHEAHFIVWMYCMERLGVVGPADHAALVLRVLGAYLALMRTLQETYWLEPAGSQGVWGLDDYHFVPFLWGAAQLVGHKYVRPRAIRTQEMVESLKDDYYYMSCIAFINRVKSAGSLVEHSPMLVDISGVKTWDKVNEGMIRMYRSLLEFEPTVQPGGDGDEDLDGDGEHRQHDHATGFSACGCVSRVPSAIAASKLSLPLSSSSSSTLSESLPISPRSAKTHFFPLD